MAFCITFGTQEFTSRLQGYEQVRAFCRNCGNWDGYCVSSWTWVTICFIPVIPLSTHKYREVRCGRCGFMQDLSIRPDITPTTQPPPGGYLGPAYGPPPQHYGQQYFGPQPLPSPGQQGPPPVASGGNPDAGYTYK